MNHCTARLACLSALLSICLSLAPAAEREKSDQSKSESTRESATKGDYVLQPQDLIKVQVFQEDDINKQGDVSISQEHAVFLPLIGNVNLKGKTVRQAEDLIRGLYDRDYLVNPQVSVIVVKYSERSVNVLGAVNSAGRILFPQERGLTILDAISLAGGQSRLADLKKVKLTRKNSEGDAVTTTINVDEMMKGGGRDAVLLEKDDVVFVPERIL
jgi:polysaccharide export outer membrane protein